MGISQQCAVFVETTIGMIVKHMRCLPGYNDDNQLMILPTFDDILSTLDFCGRRETEPLFEKLADSFYIHTSWFVSKIFKREGNFAPSWCGSLQQTPCTVSQCKRRAVSKCLPASKALHAWCTGRYVFTQNLDLWTTLGLAHKQLRRKLRINYDAIRILVYVGSSILDLLHR